LSSIPIIFVIDTEILNIILNIITFNTLYIIGSLVMATDRGWMYNRCLPNGKLDPIFVKEVRAFVEQACFNPSIVIIVHGDKWIKCPCKNCQNFFNYPAATVRMHLYKVGFCNNYKQWYWHGEPRSNVINHPPSSTTLNHEVDRMDEMLMNAAGPDFSWNARNEEETPRGKAKSFFEALNALEKPLWEIELGATRFKCESHNILSAVTRCLALKSEHNLSQKCFDEMMTLIKEMLPRNENLPESFYKSKRLVKALGMEYKTIDVCPQFCMLYQKQHINKTECDVCHEPRYEQPVTAKSIARKVLRYLPITERLQRLYMIEASAKHMRWHGEDNREKSDMMVHPADSEAWKKFDEMHKDFAKEVRK
jgi:Transposase-associated domain